MVNSKKRTNVCFKMQKGSNVYFLSFQKLPQALHILHLCRVGCLRHSPVPHQLFQRGQPQASLKHKTPRSGCPPIRPNEIQEHSLQEQELRAPPRSPSSRSIHSSPSSRPASRRCPLGKFPRSGQSAQTSPTRPCLSCS